MLDFDEEMELDPFCAFCLRCPEQVAFLDVHAPDYAEQRAALEGLVFTRDALGNHWCEEHTHRGRVIDWGARHNWPELQCDPYYIPDGAQYWQMCIAVSKDENIGYLAEAAIEFIESQVA